MGIDDLGSAGDLSTYLKLVKTIRDKWEKKKLTWDGEHVKSKGQEEALWFRGQPADAGLSPRLYRKEYKDADEAEIRQQFQSRAIQSVDASEGA